MKSLSAETFVIEINIPRISLFSLRKYNSPIRDGHNTLGRLVFKNNTKDGFNLSISSTYGGKLTSQENDEEVVSIPYTISFRPIDRNLDANIVEILNPSISIGQETPFVYLVGPPKQMSYADYEIEIDIDDVDNQLNLAGTYIDNLSIKYTDL